MQNAVTQQDACLYRQVFLLQDLGLAQNAATQQGTPTPMGSLAHQLYRIMTQSGYGGNDFSVAFKFLHDQQKKH